MMLLSLQVYADGETLHIWLSNGTKTSIQLYTCPQVTFEGNLLKVVSPMQSFEFNAADVLRFTYSGISVATDIQAVSSEKGFRNDGENLYFDGNLKENNIALYSSDGKPVPVRLLHTDTSLCLPLSALPQGVYVLNINGKTSKIVKK